MDGVRAVSRYRASLGLQDVPGSVRAGEYRRLPSSSRPLEAGASELDRLWSLEVWHRARLRAPELYPYPFHPDPGGLISWGSDKHSSEYYFLAIEPDPDEWRIVVGSEYNRWFETAGTFCEFLVRRFDRIDRPPFMDRTWPNPDARYHSHVRWGRSHQT